MLRSRLHTFLPSLLAALALTGSATALAGGTRSVKLSSFKDFDEGEAEGAAIEKSGRITVGYATQKSEVSDAVTVFSCLDGQKDALIGTSDKASVQRVIATGKGDPKAELVAELPGVVVTAMARLPGGDVVAATLPGGEIHRISGKTKGKTEAKVTPFAKLDVERIWALRVHDGKLWAATGPKGELWSIGLDGKGARIAMDVDDKDLLALEVVDGELLAGSAPSAKLFQVTGDVEGELLHDFSGDEVRALAATGDGLVAVVNDFDDRKVNSAKNLTTQLNRASLDGGPPQSSSTGLDQPKATAQLFHVDLRGAGGKRDLSRAIEAGWESWLEKKSQYFTDLLVVDEAGTVLVSSSAAGKVYRVKGRRDVSTVADLEERKATSLCRITSGNRVLATAGDGAAIYGLLGAPAAKATYLTEVFDSDQPADYGAVTIRGKGKIQVRARSGPTEEPDNRWSEWKTVGLKEAYGGRRGQVDVPRRRYVQLEVTLQDRKAELRGLEMFYAPENLAPTIAEVTFDAPSFSDDDDKEPKTTGKLKWKASDADDDDLAYEVRIRPEGTGEDEWLALVPADEVLTDDELDLDLSTIPDGVYEAEVVASDEPANGSGRARKDQLRSEPFVVDRTRPTLAGLKVQGNRVTGTAKDKASHMNDVAYAIDGGDFRPASATDGLFDETEESFEIVLGALPPGKHRLVVRARDAAGNLRTQAVVVQGQKR